MFFHVIKSYPLGFLRFLRHFSFRLQSIRTVDVDHVRPGECLIFIEMSNGD